jgi:hypothetical protein
MKKRNLILLLLVVMTMIGCADYTNVEACIPTDEHTYGFWGGVWHGAIVQFSFLGSLIWDDVDVYARNNNGGWYDFGFIGGLGIMLKFIFAVIKKYRSLK